eukprot:SAG22_NODE_2127_length_2970_cov_3.796238_4_plen_264_part_00
MTGEPLAQSKRPGEMVFAGSLLVSAQPVFLKAVKQYKESTLAMMKDALERATEKKNQANLQKTSIKMAADFTPFTLVISAVAFWLHRRANGMTVTLATWGRALAVCMAATPCPAAIGVPISFLCGLSIASRKGISMKSGKGLEELGRATCVVLDKTGTLTYGRPHVTDVKTLPPKPEGEVGGVLKLVASLEQASKHPLATAIVDHAGSTGCGLHDIDGTDVVVDENKPGFGISGTVAGRRVKVGTSEYAIGRSAGETDAALGG